MMLRIRLSVVVALLLLLIPAVALAATPAEDLQNLAGHLDVAMTKLQAGDVAGSQGDYQAFVQGWPAIEDGVRGQNASQYRAIETGMTGVTAAYAVQPADAGKVQVAMKSLDDSVDAFISSASGAPSAQAATPSAADL